MSPPSCAKSRNGNMPGRRFLVINCTIDSRYASSRRSGRTISPSGRAALIVARARSRSLGLRASTACSFTPSASAAGCVAFQAIVVNGLAGLSNATTRDNFGTASLKSSSRFPSNSGASVDSPVTFPPGFARLDTRPAATGSPASAVTMGIDWVACLGRKGARGAGGEDDVWLETDKLSCEDRITFLLSLRPHVLDDEILPLHVAEPT